MELPTVAVAQQGWLRNVNKSVAMLRQLTFFLFFLLVGELFITSVKQTCSERTTRAMFSPSVD